MTGQKLALELLYRNLDKEVIAIEYPEAKRLKITSVYYNTHEDKIVLEVIEKEDENVDN